MVGRSIQPWDPVVVEFAGAPALVAEATFFDLYHTCPVEYSVSTSCAKAPSSIRKRLALGRHLDFASFLWWLGDVLPKFGRRPVLSGWRSAHA